ncbi:hypothetical protein [Deinococcus sp. Marseille-Q6407]|uniref:hypothetical protein n=1 Tax=Deinococcus sp. Marseille-Q6407 TaxID=2969223 RepID=UPI0021C1C3AC|nr:hypothetical protein [Deinococcus sp. Marseille-Q6407]
MSKKKMMAALLLLGLTSPALAQAGGAQSGRVPTRPAATPVQGMQGGRATPAATPQAAMQQFCQDLDRQGWQTAIGKMLGVSQKQITQLFNANIDDREMVAAGNEMLSKSRCQVLSAQGTQVRVRASGADFVAMMKRVMNDPAVQQVELGQLQGLKTDADMAQAAVQSMQRQYQIGQLPLYTRTLNVELERLNGRWVLTDDSVSVLFDVLTGGASRVDD